MFVWKTFVSICLLLIFEIEAAPVETSIKHSLYNTNDHVGILMTENFTEYVVNGHRDGKRLQMIQFYNSWCGHCIDFAPTFRQFVRSVLPWNDSLSISTVDCSIESNQKVCRDYDIQFYPTIRMFWFKPTEKDKGDNFRVAEPKVNFIRKAVLKWITDNWKKHLDSIPKLFPPFQPLLGNDKDELIAQLRLDDYPQPALIVVESDQSFLGRTLMMDFNRYSSHVRIYRMVESDIRLLDQILPQTLDHFKLPFLLTIDGGKGKEKKFSVIPRPLMGTESDHVFFTKLIRSQFIKDVQFNDELFQQQGSAVGGDTNVERPNDMQISDRAVLPIVYSTRVYQSDLHNAIRFLLYHEVMLKSSLNLEQTQTLIHLLSVLYDHFPFQSTKTKQFVLYIHDWLEKKATTLGKLHLVVHQKSSKKKMNGINTTDLRSTMNIYEDYYHFPELKPYRACADADSTKKRGYPCSLWTLFHVLTVAEYRRSQQLKQWSSLHPTLYSMREYIQNFFGCSECREHFLEMATTMENELTYSNSSILWLWRAHNLVNSRLKGTGSEDTIHLPKRQFPTYEECPECYLTKPTQTSLLDSLQKNSTAFSTKFYNQTKVLDFLVNYYSLERIVQDGEETENGEQKKLHHNQMAASASKHPKQQQQQHLSFDLNETNPRKKSNILFSYVPFTSIDYSLIFIFYIVSIALLVSLCFVFKLRKNRKNGRRYPI